MSSRANKENENIIPQQAEQTKKLLDRKEGAPPSNEENVQTTGLGGLTDDNFFENIDNILGLPELKAATNEEISHNIKADKPSDPLRDELLALYEGRE
ncbi:33728_t:CDS:2 [Gigaspora margarita]|uniref:33728_t:CDS:1 n=1 Tax=Gigaspora margarita TaxID=4874 RepID=A0ABN7VZJ5_GIGMA|nr:33728_t:CDS:2 [Gigaspora margarita]